MKRVVPLVLASVLLASAGASAATIVVTNTNNAGPGSLRQAILDANDRGGPDVITFDIPGPGPFVITVSSPLPPFDAQGAVTVDGTTQPGYALRPLLGTGGTVGVDQLPLLQIRSPSVQVFGNGLAASGLVFTAGNSILRGLHVWGFTGINVAFTGANGASVVQSLIGATAAFGDPGPGLRAGTNLVLDGGNNPSLRNNLVAYASGPDNILVVDQGGQVLVEGNELVGSLRLSSEPPPGSPLGVPNRFISGNLIRDSVSCGIDVIGGQSHLTISNNTVQGNGTGTVNPAGIRLTSTATETTTGNVLVRNVVTGNQGAGILITGGAGGGNHSNTITRNSIFMNGGIGIDLGGEGSDPLTGDGQTLNDPADADTGGNTLFNFPVIERATFSGSSLVVTGWSGSKTTIEFFADPAGSQGRTFIASLDEGSANDDDSTTGSYGPGPVNGVNQGTDLTERFRFVIPLPSGLQAGSVLTATATAREAPSTSEFGGAAPVTFAGDLRITKTGPASVTPGTHLSYALVVMNNGPASASGVTVADVTPPGLTFVSTTGACTTPFPCVLGTLASGQSAAITATFAVPADYTAPAPIVNTASVSSQASDLDPSNNAATISTVVGPPRADLVIAKSRPQRRGLGASLEYTIVVTNHGPSDAPTATVADPTPAGLTFTSNAGACTTAFPCALGPIPAGQTRVIRTAFLVPSGYAGPDPIVNTATVSSPAADPDLINNTATVSTAVGPLFTINVEVSKAGPAGVTPGHNLVYAMTVSNTGTLDATGVTVTDPTPAGLVFVSNAGACTTPFPCSLGVVPAGQTRHITTIFAVPAGYAGANPIINTAAVTTTVADEDLTDNQATATTPVRTPATDVAISKTGPAAATTGALVTYTIVVGTGGPSDATGVTVSDSTPGGLTFVGNTGDCVTPFPCALGTISVGQTRTIHATFAIPQGYSGPTSLIITATAATTASDLDSGNNASSVTTAVITPVADLRITKSGEAAARPGETISYVLTVSNAGPAAARAVTVSDPVPGGLTFVSNTGDCATPFPCSLGTLAPGETRAIAATFSVDPAVAPGTIVNTATVSAATVDPAPADNTSQFSTAVDDLTPAVADLALTKAASVANVTPGGAITYVLSARNLGPDEAGDVSIADSLPATVGFVSASPSPGGSCAAPRSVLGGSVRCDWLEGTPVGAEGERSVRIVVRVPAGTPEGTTILNTARVTTTSIDAVVQNDSASAATTVYAGETSADLEVLKSLAGGSNQAIVGQPFVFQLQVVNHGPADATGIVVTDTLPASLTAVSANPGQGSFDLQTGAWTVGALSQGSVATLELTVVTAQPGPLQNRLERVTSQPVDPNAGNDTSVVTFEVLPATADVSIVKTGRTSVAPGGTIRYSIVVANAGPSNATAVVVNDVTPAGLTFVSNTGDCVTAFPCALGTLPAGSIRTIVATFTVPRSAAVPGSIANSAAVTTSTADPVTANNTATAVTRIARRIGCDIDGNGVDEIVTGAGPGGGPHVRAFSLALGSVTEVASFYAYDPRFGGGVFVACGDVDGDGLAEIVTGAGAGGAPHVRAFSLAGGNVTEVAGFHAYDPWFAGGVTVAVGDVDGDGTADIVTGAGPGGGPHVRAFGLAGGLTELVSFNAYASTFTGGVFVAAADVTEDGRAEIITGTTHEGGPVRIFGIGGPGDVTELASAFAYFDRFLGPVRVAAADVDGDGQPDIITGAGPGGGPHVRALSLSGGVLTELASFYAYDSSFCDLANGTPAPAGCDGVYVSGADVTGDGVAEIVTGTNRAAGPVRVFQVPTPGHVTELTNFYPYFSAFPGPVRVAAANPDSGTTGSGDKRNTDMIDSCGGLSAVSRRGFMQRAACAVAGTALAAPSSGFASGQGPRHGREVLREFPYGAVQLTGGPVKQHFDRIHAHFLALDNDRLLKVFRERAGLPAPGPDMGGWYDTNGFVPGLTLGQYISGLARLGAATGDKAAHHKVARLVSGFGEFIRRGESPYAGPNAQAQWAAYVMDKYIVGLVDAFRLSGVEEAKRLLPVTIDKCLPYISPVSRDRIGKKDPPYDETYVISENLFHVAAITGDDKYRKLAVHYLLDKEWFDPLAAGVDVLPEKHAYSHTIALSSGAQAYLNLGDDKYLRALTNAWRFLEPQRFASGGWAPEEQFVHLGQGKLAESLKTSKAHFETPCGSFADLKLARYLIRLTGRPEYGDGLERTLYNTMLATRLPNSDGDYPYYSDYGAGAEKRYYHRKWPCCSGTLVQGVADYVLNAYFHDDDALVVNLFVSSEVVWTRAGGAVTIVQQTDYPAADAVRLTVKEPGNGRYAIKLRIPAWTTGATLRVNGKAEPVAPGELAAVKRDWKAGDTIDLNVPQPLRTLPIDTENPNLAALMRGAVMYVGLNPWDGIGAASISLPGSLSPLSASGQAYRTEVGGRDLVFVPYFTVDTERYHTYFTIA